MSRDGIQNKYAQSKDILEIYVISPRHSPEESNYKL